MKLYRTLLLAAAALVISCNSRKDSISYIPEAPDYTDNEMWICDTICSGNTKGANVFYISPTCIWDWKSSDGTMYHHMDTRNVEQRSSVASAVKLASELLGKDCRFWAPYYRQITMESWMTDPKTTEDRFRTAFEDIQKAFKYFYDNINGGSPFILAGHSQGGKAVIELLKNTLTDSQRQNLVASYVFGFGITEEEINAYPDKLRPAADSSDTGVIVSFNSVSSLEGMSEMFYDNVVCINPLNWRTDTTYASPDMNRGTVFFDAAGKPDTLLHQVGARISSKYKTLIIDGLNDDDYFIESISSIFPKGNYHVQELNLYFINIQDNIRCRTDAFYNGRQL